MDLIYIVNAHYKKFLQIQFFVKTTNVSQSISFVEVKELHFWQLAGERDIKGMEC